MEDAASSAVAGKGVHSSRTIEMSASRARWISTQRSGVSWWRLPSMCDLKVTPSSAMSRISARDITWKPPESVRMGPGQFMNSCKPPRRSTISAPGRSIRW